MGLSRALYTAWTGLATHQRALDNTGNNLANSNTVGFKSNDFLFTNLFNQVLTGSTPGDGIRAAVGATTMGAGVTTGAISPNWRAGAPESTGRNLDVAVNGQGFFLVSTPYGAALTRDGSFYLDHSIDPNRRLLCQGAGNLVQGWMAEGGIVTPGTTTTNILLPAVGDHLPGKTTGNAALSGVLPSNPTGADFNGSATRTLELAGNLAEGRNTVRASIHAPVTRTGNGVETKSGEFQEIPVEMVFSDPVVSGDGLTTSWSWTMSAVDWPNPGDPPIRIYPAADGSTVSGAVSFWNADDPDRNRAAGQIVGGELVPGSTSVETVLYPEGGGELSVSFDIGSSFRIDVSRMTSLADPPVAAGPRVWSVDGAATDSLSRAVSVFEEVVAFERVEDANGDIAMRAVRRVQERQERLHFTRTSTADNESVWSWKATPEGASGELVFNGHGDLTTWTSNGGSINFDLSDFRTLATSASVEATSQDGFVDGFLQDISIDHNGRFFGSYSNQVVELLAQLAMATTPNPSGLIGSSGTLFHASAASGDIMIGVAGDAGGSAGGLPAIGAGTLIPQHLEGSNTELAIEFTNLISIERGYQANARVISTADEMLQQLAALKR
jgi:flagellar hook protein FlgE